MEIEKEICVKDFISCNLEMFHKLDLVGVKSISSAIDLLHVYNIYNQYKWIKNKTERKKVTASACRVSVRMVEKAIHMMSKGIKKTSTD